MEFDLEKARELFETGQFASITRALGPASNYIRQIHPLDAAFWHTHWSIRGALLSRPNSPTLLAT